MPDSELERLRGQFDEIDERIVRLLGERMALSAKVGEVKAAADAPSYTDHAREAQILRRVVELGEGRVDAGLLERLYREIMAESLALQMPTRVCHLGPPGTYSEEAARLRFGAAANLLPQATIADCFAQVEQEHADHAIVPYENSTDGGIGETLDLLFGTTLTAVGETRLRIRQNLMAPAGTSIDSVRQLYSHPASFAQCAKWLRANLQSSVEQNTAASNAAAAEQAAAAGAGAASIGPRIAGELYGLDILESGVEDNPRNTTRFLILGRRPTAPSGDDKTSLIVAVSHRPGSLFAMLKSFADAKLNMSRLESRPMPRSEIGQYMFFIDVEGHRDTEPLAGLLERLPAHSEMLKVLGSYPAAPAA